jgi:hypothetical protein
VDLGATSYTSATLQQDKRRKKRPGGHRQSSSKNGAVQPLPILLEADPKFLKAGFSQAGMVMFAKNHGAA